jgi:chitinase
MNDPGPYRTTFSDLAKSTSAQDAFFESLITFMQANNFDGVDIDWEYPVADDRGGIKEDFGNFVTLIRRLRQRLNATGRKYGLSITLVSERTCASPPTWNTGLIILSSRHHIGTSGVSILSS